VSRRLIPQLEPGHYFVIRHSCFVILVVRVYSRDSAQVFSPLRATIDENFRTLCFVQQSAGLLECARVRASLLGEKAVDRKAMRRRIALPKHFVQRAVDAF
jgi:hypothetical protein